LKPKVLIVEDVFLIGWAIEATIRSFGYESTCIATSVAEAHAILNTDVIDAAILDIDLDGELSIGIADRLAGGRIPFAFVTGYESPALLPDHLRGYPRIGKPIHREELRRTLASLLATAPRPTAPSH